MFTSLVSLAALTYGLLKLLPGSPFDHEESLHPLVLEKMAKIWPRHDNFILEFFQYFWSVLKGDLGISMSHPELSVLELMSQGWGNTILLNLISLVVILAAAVVVSLVAVKYKETSLEEFIDQLVITGLSLPSLFWGPLLIYIFAVHFDLLPIAFLTSPLHFVLPVVTMSVRPTASLIRLLKNSLKENSYSDYARTATAKGLGSWGVLTKHILRNSLVPFLSYLGPLIVSLISGSFLVEMLFAVPGMGTDFIRALAERDYTVIMGMTLFYGGLLIVVNIAIDVLIKIIDPRLREKT